MTSPCSTVLGSMVLLSLRVASARRHFTTEDNEKLTCGQEKGLLPS